MKITAEFNSTEELVSFIGAFGTKGLISSGVASVSSVTPVAEIKKAAKVEEVKKLDKPAAPVKEDKPVEEIKDIAPAKEAENPKEEVIKPEENKEVNVTKEMVRERLGVIMKSGKQKEVKALFALHGAGKLPDLKEEEYAAVYSEAEALL